MSIDEEMTSHQNKLSSMAKLIFFGLVAAFFFSSTFVLNRWMSAEGGHWFWTASLRYIYVFLFLTFLILILKGSCHIRESFQCYKKNWRFWTVAGGIGFALFYMSLCFSASFAPGWVIATTWQVTIIASPIVLVLMGCKVPFRGFLFVFLIFAGILMVNFDQLSKLSSKLAWTLLPVLFAAFCYPFGNTLCGFAKNGGHKMIKQITNPVINDAFCRVWLMTCGALPILFVVGIVVHPPSPTIVQLKSTLFVAISTGVVATSIFLYARHSANNTFAIAAVDSTQAGEIPFALLLEWGFFNGALPKLIGFVGLCLVVIGIVLFALSQSVEGKA